MFHERQSVVKFSDGASSLVVVLFSVALLALGLLANPIVSLTATNRTISVPAWTVYTLVGLLGILIHAVLHGQAKRIRALEAQVSPATPQ